MLQVGKNIALSTADTIGKTLVIGFVARSLTGLAKTVQDAITNQLPDSYRPTFDTTYAKSLKLAPLAKSICSAALQLTVGAVALCFLNRATGSFAPAAFNALHNRISRM